jgi:hypothetical protein
MFRTKIDLLLASSVDVRFWTYELLQIAEAYPTVRRAVAALAAAYQSYILSNDGEDTQEQFVIQYYGESLSSLR